MIKVKPWFRIDLAYPLVNGLVEETSATFGPHCQADAWFGQHHTYIACSIRIKKPSDLSKLLVGESPKIARLQEKIKSRQPNYPQIERRFHEEFLDRWHSKTRDFGISKSVRPLSYIIYNWVPPYSFSLDGWQASNFNFKESSWKTS